MGRRIPQKEMMLNAVSAATVSTASRVSDYRNCVLAIIGSPTANMKIFVKGAISQGANLDTAPDFTVLSSARSGSGNSWDFIEVVDLQDGTAIDGTTGINLSGNRVRLIEVNINSLDWLVVHASGIVSGSVTVVGSFTTNI